MKAAFYRGGSVYRVLYDETVIERTNEWTSSNYVPGALRPNSHETNETTCLPVKKLKAPLPRAGPPDGTGSLFGGAFYYTRTFSLNLRLDLRKIGAFSSVVNG